MNSIHSVTSIAKSIDHAVLSPTATVGDIDAGCRLAVTRDIAAFCVHSNSVESARSGLDGSDVALAAVVGFPHGNTVTEIKRAEAIQAIESGAEEIDMVLNIGQVCSANWGNVAYDIRRLDDAVTSRGALLKVIFETGYLSDQQIVRLCEICGQIGVAYIKTSTGFGFVKGESGEWRTTGATLHHVRLMRKHAPGTVGIKASGGIRTLNDLLAMIEAGATRIGTSSTEAILQEASSRGL